MCFLNHCVFGFQSAAGGILGLVLAMLVETLLFIIKTSKDDQIQSSKSSSSFTPTTKKNQ